MIFQKHKITFMQKETIPMKEEYGPAREGLRPCT